MGHLRAVSSAYALDVLKGCGEKFESWCRLTYRDRRSCVKQMKSACGLTAVTFMLLVTTILAVAGEKFAQIEGAFGLRLGETQQNARPDFGSQWPLSDSKTVLGTYWINPPSPSGPFSKYGVVVSPRFKRVFIIVGRGDDTSECTNFLAVRSALSSKYGPPSSAREAPGSTTYTFRQRSREITLSGCPKGTSGDVEVIYRDYELERLAIKEQNEIDRQEIDTRAEKIKPGNI